MFIRKLLFSGSVRITFLSHSECLSLFHRVEDVEKLYKDAVVQR